MAIQQVTGVVTYLRVHERGTGYGPPGDELNDAEVVVKVRGHPQAFGLGLRAGDRLAAAQAMFALLQDSFGTNTPATLEYDARPGRANHYLMRVIRTR